jgi:steroid delta-isomerase-like uncharacterized protein
VQSVEANQDVVRRYHDAFNRGDFETALASFAAQVSNHGRLVPAQVMRAIWSDIHTRFPDIRLGIDHIIATDQEVVVRSTYAGTHLGVGRLPVDGGLMVGVAATGRAFSVQHIHWYELRDGLIVAHRACRDDISMMVQLGLLPEPPPFAPPGR